MRCYAALGALLALVSPSYANVDIVSLFVPSGNFIEEAVATLVVGDIPSPITGDIALWSAIMLDKQDFLQGVTQNSPEGLGYCQNLGENWCNFAYVLGGMRIHFPIHVLYLPSNGGDANEIRGAANGNAEAGATATASPGVRIKTHYKLNAETDSWDQKMYINDELVSELTTSQGQRGSIFYVSTECAAGSCAPAPEHSWEDISITLNQPDESFGQNGDWEYGATGGEMSTSDGGKTWNFTTLVVPETRP